MRSTNILKVYRSATPEQVQAGMTWYQRAHDIAADIAPTVEQGAGVIAALSPKCNWERNLELAIRAFDQGFASGAMGDGCRKATAIIQGADPLDVLGGDKVRSFYVNILDPECRSTVTVDRHAYDVAYGIRTADAKRPTIKGKNYVMLADLYRRAARIEKVLPQQIQAITWEAWRDEFGGVRVAA